MQLFVPLSTNLSPYDPDLVSPFPVKLANSLQPIDMLQVLDKKKKKKFLGAKHCLDCQEK